MGPPGGGFWSGDPKFSPKANHEGFLTSPEIDNFVGRVSPFPKTIYMEYLYTAKCDCGAGRKTPNF